MKEAAKSNTLRRTAAFGKANDKVEFSEGSEAE